MYEVFNNVLKGARSLPVTALVQLTYFRLNSYFVARRKQGYNKLASDEQCTLYVDAKIKAYVRPEKIPIFGKRVKSLFWLKSEIFLDLR